MSEHTPTTDEVRDGYVEGVEHDCYYEGDVKTTPDGLYEGERFDRWLAEVEQRAAEKALHKAAGDLSVTFSRGAAIAMHHECHKKQCRCGNPGNDEIVREVFEAAREAIRNEALAYRRNEGENE